MVKMIRKTPIEIHPILLILEPKHGHQELFNSLQVFIQQFLKEKLSFLTFLLYDQLDNHRFYYQHQREIQIPKPNEYITINKRSRLVFDQKVAGAFQVKKSEAEEQYINCINVWRKFLLII
jgi:hypothetical protein